MPLSIEGVVVPWWAYAILIVIIIIAIYAFYKNITAYTPPITAFNTTESPLPTSYDPTGVAQNADNVLDEFFGSDDQTLIDSLLSLTDNELISVSNAYNSAYFSEHNQTLLQRLQGIDTDNLFTNTGALRDQLVTRMQGLNIT